MRKPTYLSPSGIQTWLAGIDGYYLKYLTDTPPPREGQTPPMAVGSSFDAYCKSYLHEILFGKGHVNSSKFEFQTIFEAQVEPELRDWALPAGKYAFDCYKKSGALNDLLIDLKTASTEPRFEFDLQGAVNGYREGFATEVNTVTLLGKPDLAFSNKDGVFVIFDWKVSAFCSKWPVSPVAGYVRLRDSMGGNIGPHPKANLYEHQGITINIGSFLDFHKSEWALQLSIYSWLLGQPIGGDFIVAIDQLVCKPAQVNRPDIRVAEHRIRVSGNFQWESFKTICGIWEIVQSDHIYRDLSLEDSKLKCSLLDKQAIELYGDQSDEGKLFRDMTRR